MTPPEPGTLRFPPEANFRGPRRPVWLVYTGREKSGAGGGRRGTYLGTRRDLFHPPTPIISPWGAGGAARPAGYSAQHHGGTRLRPGPLPGQPAGAIRTDGHTGNSVIPKNRGGRSCVKTSTGSQALGPISLDGVGAKIPPAPANGLGAGNTNRRAPHPGAGRSTKRGGPGVHANSGMGAETEFPPHGWGFGQSHFRRDFPGRVDRRGRGRESKKVGKNRPKRKIRAHGKHTQVGGGGRGKFCGIRKGRFSGGWGFSSPGGRMGSLTTVGWGAEGGGGGKNQWEVAAGGGARKR